MLNFAGGIVVSMVQLLIKNQVQADIPLEIDDQSTVEDLKQQILSKLIDKSYRAEMVRLFSWGKELKPGTKVTGHRPPACTSGVAEYSHLRQSSSARAASTTLAASAVLSSYSTPALIATVESFT